MRSVGNSVFLTVGSFVFATFGHFASVFCRCRGFTGRGTRYERQNCVLEGRYARKPVGQLFDPDTANNSRLFSWTIWQCHPSRCISRHLTITTRQFDVPDHDYAIKRWNWLSNWRFKKQRKLKCRKIHNAAIKLLRIFARGEILRFALRHVRCFCRIIRAGLGNSLCSNIGIQQHSHKPFPPSWGEALNRGRRHPLVM